MPFLGGDQPWWKPYEPDPGKVQSSRMLALAMALTAAVGAAPGLWALGGEHLPAWAVAALAVAAVQVLYLLWMLALPDWSTVWVGMVVFALTGASYGAVAAWLAFVPEERGENLLELLPLRRQALGWSVAEMTLCVLVTYAAGRLAAGWRKALNLRLQRLQQEMQVGSAEKLSG